MAFEQRQALGGDPVVRRVPPVPEGPLGVGDRDSGRYLVKFSWTPIVRHRLVEGRASVDDPDLADYWARQRRRDRPPLGPFLLG